MTKCTIERLVTERLASLSLPVGLVLDPTRLTPRPEQKADAVTLHVLDSGVLIHLAMGQVGRVAGDYVEGRLDIEGSPRDIARAAADLIKEPTAPTSFWRQVKKQASSLWRHTRRADARQIEFHYDVSDDFYALWLDPRRVYSCAYFREPQLTLAQAQEAKLDHICRKLMLRPGERFLDIGAGWGGLLLYAAENYDVKATGITLSKNQYRYVSDLIKERGLKNVQVKLMDYRDLPIGVLYDKIASVGMFEHVGRAKLPEYFNKVYSLLEPGGLFLNHGITAGGIKNRELGGGVGEFIGKYIFPGGELHHISHAIERMASSKLEVLDVENLRPHYARTLWHWSDKLEENLLKARELVSEKVVRAYRLYLAGSAVSFERGWIALHQVLASRPSGLVTIGSMDGAQTHYPFSREYMYRPVREPVPENLEDLIARITPENRHS